MPRWLPISMLVGGLAIGAVGVAMLSVPVSLIAIGVALIALAISEVWPESPATPRTRGKG